MAATTHTEGNSCATTPAMPASILRVTLLVQPGSARQAETADSQSGSGALGTPPRCRLYARVAAEAWTQLGNASQRASGQVVVGSVGVRIPRSGRMLGGLRH
jgi:hypothetical protein